MPGIRVIMDTVEGQSLKQGDDRKVTRVRTGKVYNLTDRKDPLQQARTAVDSIDATIRVPRFGDFHPKVPGIICRGVEFEHFNVAWNQARFTATYSAIAGSNNGGPLLVDVLVNGTSVMKRTNFDCARGAAGQGDVLWVYYDQGARSLNSNDPKLYKSFPDQKAMALEYANAKAGNRPTSVLREPGEVDVPVSSPTIEFVYVRIGNPWTAWGDFVDTINADSFQGDPAGTWICRLITGHTEFIAGNLPTTKMPWRASIVFQRSPGGKGFQEVLLFRDSRTGKIPADIDNPPSNTLANGHLFPGKGQIGKMGYGIFDVIPWKKWAPMGLPDISSL